MGPVVRRNAKVFLKNGKIKEYALSDALILIYHKAHSSRKEFISYYGYSPDIIDIISWDYSNFKEIEKEGKIIRNEQEKNYKIPIL
jgi:hypothetical protein